MSKDAYYFSHDTNASNDPKIKALIKAYGIEGYGRFWIIIETMAEQSDYRLQHKQWQMDALAMAMLCDTDAITEFINSCINQFELFESDGTFFWSASLTRRMNIKEEKKKKRIEAGKKGAENRWKDGNGEQSHSNGVAKHGKGKESKGKESKKEYIYTPEFESWYKSWPRASAKQDSFKNFEKARKKHGLEFILMCSKNYLDYFRSLPEKDQGYPYQSNNFFGQKAYYLDYTEPKATSGDAAKDILGDDTIICN